ncbi:MAG: hypothetical protein LKI23_06890 [Bifidobacterium crudilactis]|jgi:hypothetical protein|nr:hypothetical protein [Bifidobacterium crudilactis]
MISYFLLPYSIIADESDESAKAFRGVVKEAINRFTCTRSNSVSDFVHNKMNGIEKSHDGCTYLFVTRSKSGSFIEIAGFFELCLTSIDFSRLSKNKRSEFKGAHTHLRGDHAGSYSIGELGRSELFTKEDLPGEVILQEAINIIVDCRNRISGRYTLIEARDEIFESLYKPYGFKKVDTTHVEREGDCPIVVGMAKTTKWEIVPVDRGNALTA